MNILSLYDGIACGRVALEKAGFKVKKYFASEICPYAIKTALKNYPDIIELGNVFDLDFKKFAKENKIDMVIAGVPCIFFSAAKKNREISLDGEGGKLFYKFKEALEIIKPKYFLMENVNSMHKDVRAAIDKELGVKSIMINSALVSAQQRKRLYWCNWEVAQPKDKGILLDDVLDNASALQVKSYCITAPEYKGSNLKQTLDKHRRTMVACAMRTYPRLKITGEKRVKRPEIRKDKKSNCLTSVQSDSMVLSSVKIGHFGKGGQGERIYSVKGKSICLSANGGGKGAKTGLYKINLPDEDYTIRKLTPLECERLQTLPDNYTQGVSNTQRYKQLGNGWTVDVIAHIFKQIN